mmetsp:Transcript_58416/g.166124  ORF Transcript_58416/g.166124 Transcript_58416/m.166124 type:complete len:258 (-) Transcript_58416:74-847(-)
MSAALSSSPFAEMKLSTSGPAARAGPLPEEAAFASRMRAKSVAEGFRAPPMPPRAMTRACSSFARPLKSLAALSSMLLDPRNSSILSAAVSTVTWSPSIGAMDWFLLASLMRAKTVAEGHRAVRSSPREMTAPCTCGGQLRSASPASPSKPYSAMKPSTSSIEAPALPLSPAGAPGAPNLPCLASLIRERSVADGFRAVASSPRDMTCAWTSTGQALKASAPASSMPAASRNSSTSPGSGSPAGRPGSARPSMRPSR